MRNGIIPPNTPIVGQLVPNREWWRFFNSLNQAANDASGGSVTTGPTSGLAGGGEVAGGISIRIADNGVTNTMLRQSLGLSIIGRAFNSAGNVADITADADNRVLCRESGQLAFRSSINVGIGQATPNRGTFTAFGARVRATAADTAFGADDYCITMDATAAARVATLPALTAGRNVILKKTDASANSVTLDGAGADTIDGAATYVLAAQYDAVEVIGGATEWHVI